jgi:O-antigen/teichoic acid export membrane protein
MRAAFGEVAEKMRSALLSKTGRDTQIVFAGQVLSALLGFLLNVILLRVMSTGEYGLFSLFFSSMMLVSGFMHLGWADTFVRFGARHFPSKKFEAIRYRLFSNVFLSALAIGVAGIACSHWVAARVYGREDFSSYAKLAMICAFLITVFSFIQNDLRTRASFKPYFWMNVGTAFARFVLIAAMASAGLLILSRVIGVYIWVFVAVVVPYLVIWRGFKTPGSGESLDAATVSEIRQFNAWSLVSLVAVNVIGNIDSQFIAHYHDNSTLSAFGAASRLTLPISMAISSMTATLLPRLSAAKSEGDYRLYLDRIKLFLIPSALAVIAMVWVAPPLLIAIAGAKYAGIELLIRLQVLAMLVVLLANPVGLVITAWGWTRLLAIMNLFQLVVDLYLDWVWIPRYGAAGAVAATLVINIVGMVCIYVALFYGLKARRT